MATLLLYPHMVERESSGLSSSQVQTLISAWGATLMTSFKPNHLPKAPPPNTITSEVRAPTYEYGEDIQIQSIIKINLPGKAPMPT